MKKIFTFAAALLASFSLWADDATFTMSEIFDGTSQEAVVTSPLDATVSTNTSKGNAATGKLGSDGNYFQIVLADQTFSAVGFNGYINTSSTEKNWAFQFSTDGGTTWSEEVTQANDGNKTAHDIAVEAAVPENANGFRVVRRAGTSTVVNSITLTVGGSVAPSEDPVSTVSIEGPTECFVGKKITLQAIFDVKPDTIWWTDKFGQDLGNDKAAMEFAPEAVGSYTFVAWGQNKFNVSPVCSDIFTVGVSEKPAATACAELYPAASGTAAAEGAKVTLKEESFGGSIIFAGAKSWAESFQYNEYGLQMCKGGADSVRVELGFKLQEGSEIELQINQNGLKNDKARGFKLLGPGKKTLLTAAWTQESEDDLARSFSYTVTKDDGLAGHNIFWLQRNESAILHAVVVSDCGEEIIPDTDPVTAATISGKDACYVGSSVTLSCSADKANAYQWYLDGNAVEGAVGVSYIFTPEAEGSYAIYCTATNEYTASPVQSNTITVVATEKPAELVQVDVTGDIVWDWTKAASVEEIKLDANSTPKKNEQALLANIEGMNNDANFNSQALLFEGEYPVRSGKYCQGQLLQFHSTVAGFLTVVYSNTGNREKAEGEEEGKEALRRFLVVNGELVEGDPGSMVSNANTTVYNIPVAAGDVAISGRMPYRTDGKDVNQAEYVRLYFVQFSLSELPQGLESTEATLKAVKVMRDGQLFIQKNGVLYNMQGAIVK